MEIIPYQFTSEDTKVTTYKLFFENNIIMLDCGSFFLQKNDFVDVKYIFISHAHLDHWIGLYDNYKYISDDTIILATCTTKRLIKEIAYDRLNGELSMSSVDKRKIRNLFNNIKEMYFEEPLKTDNLTFTLYPAGHMFGASMLYIEGNDKTFLYTGDIDYVEGNSVRSYYFDCKKRVDFLLIDGTKLYTDTFKKESISGIKNDIKNFRDNLFNLEVKDKTKAVFYAFALESAKELQDYRIIYGDDLTNVNSILYEQGYDIYKKDRIISTKMNKEKYQKIIKITTRANPKEGRKFGEFRLGLHISADEINEFIFQYANKAKVMIGHFDLINLNELIKKYPNYHFLVNSKKYVFKEVSQK